MVGCHSNEIAALDVGRKAAWRLVGVVLAVGVALLQRGGRGAGGRGAGEFAPGRGEQGGGDGGCGRHGDLEELVALDQPDESFEAFERRLRVSLLRQQPLPQVHAALRDGRRSKVNLSPHFLNTDNSILTKYYDIFYLLRNPTR